MGKYSNVNYAALEQAADVALNELVTYNFDQAKNSINMHGVMPKEVGSVAINSLKDIEKKDSLVGSFSMLKFNLNKLIKVAKKIEAYQDYEYEIELFKQRMDHDDDSDERKLKKMKNKLKEKEKDIDKAIEEKKGWFN